MRLSQKQQQRRPWVVMVPILAMAFLLIQTLPSTSASSPGGIIVRIRLADGSMEKVMIPESSTDTMSVRDILEPFDVEDDVTVQLGSDTIDTSNILSTLNLKHGSLITIQSTSSSTTKRSTESRFSHLTGGDPNSSVWNPFPDLAKNYEQALLKSKTKRASNKGMSYGAIAQLQSSLHVVEAQPEGPLKRVYMCRYSAERFHVNGMGKKKKGKEAPAVQPRVGLLLGTFQRERVDKTPRKARTSLSSQTSDSDYCTVAKVHAIWEPSSQKLTMTSKGNSYNVQLAQSLLGSRTSTSSTSTQQERVSTIASQLGLVPVGWIFSHVDERHDTEDSLPVYGLDVQMGASLQIVRMKEQQQQEAEKTADAAAAVVKGSSKAFVTLAMNANTGATEAFQLSDVSVQMVHEGLLTSSSLGLHPQEPDNGIIASMTETLNTREVPTKHNVLINGKESKMLDSVLCLVNTAMLSHEGSFSGGKATSSIKKNGSLTNDAKKSLLGCWNTAADDDEGVDSKLLEMLCDFNTILALDQSLTPEETTILCTAVKKWARGQKKGTHLDAKIKLRLRSILET